MRYHIFFFSETLFVAHIFQVPTSMSPLLLIPTTSVFHLRRARPRDFRSFNITLRLQTEAALGAGVERSKYDQWLRRFGKEARTELWWPLMKARRQLREAAGDQSEDDVGDESSGESDESGDASD